MPSFSLSGKFALAISVALMLFSLGTFLVLSLVVMPGFTTLEQESANKDIERCVNSILDEMKHMDLFNRDWASWTDTYVYVQDHNEDFVEANLVPESLIDNQIALMHIADLQGNTVWSRAWDGESEDVIEAPGILLDAWPGSWPPQLGEPSDDPNHDYMRGVLCTELGPLLISARPVLTSENEGPSMGTYVMARNLDESLMDSLRAQTQVDFHLWSTADGEPRELAERAGMEKHLVLERELGGIGGTPGVTLRAYIPRHIGDKGVAVVKFAMQTVLIGGLVLLVVTLVASSIFVSRPIHKLVKSVVDVAESHNIETRLPSAGRDEIGRISESVNHLLESLARTISERDQLKERLYREEKQKSLKVMAGSVAHRFNNMLQSVLGYHEVVLERLSKGSDERKLLTEANNAAMNAAQLSSEMLTLVGMGSVGLERFDLTKQVGESWNTLWMGVPSFIHRDFHPSDTDLMVNADLEQIKQIASSLIINAVESMGEQGGTVTITTSEMDCDRAYLDSTANGTSLPEGRYAFLEVKDSGQGMDDKTLAKIFDPFFTTKFVGRGLGLSTTLGIVRAHHGTIHVESQPDKGTTVRVMLPLVEAEIGVTDGKPG